MIHNVPADATTEVKKYLSDAFLPRTHDPLTYWRESSNLSSFVCLLKKIEFFDSREINIFE